MNKVTIDRIVCLFLVLSCGFLFTITNSFPEGAASFPRLLIYIMIGLVLILFFGTLKKGNKKQEEGQEGESIQRGSGKPFVTFGLTVVYVCLINLLGFFTSSFLFVLSLMLYLGVRNWKSYAYTILGLGLFVYFLFEVQLNVQFPRGILF